MENIKDELNKIKLSISSSFTKNINPKMINILEELNEYENNIKEVKDKLISLINIADNDNRDLILNIINILNDYNNQISTTYSQLTLRSRILLEMCRLLLLD